MQKKQVLVLEDDPTSEILLRRLIHSVAPAAEIDCEESAEQALLNIDRKSTAGQKYDLIIADIFLSGKATGVDFWQACGDRFLDIPILITSGLPAIRYFEYIGRNSIAPTYLPKPLCLPECKAILEDILV